MRAFSQLAGWMVALTAALASAQTEVLFNFDTEDYTSDYANDAIRHQLWTLRHE